MHLRELTSPFSGRTHAASERQGAGRMSRETETTMNSSRLIFMPDIPCARSGGTVADASVREENAH
jgi:hypothetical protein